MPTTLVTVQMMKHTADIYHRQSDAKLEPRARIAHKECMPSLHVILTRDGDVRLELDPDSHATRDGADPQAGKGDPEGVPALWMHQ